MRADHIAQGIIHLDFKSPQGMHNLFGQPIVVLDCPYDESIFSYILSKSLILT